MSKTHTLTAILPCNDVDASEAFYAKLGFERVAAYDDYRILSDGKGAEIHLNNAVEGWLIPGRNPFALYLYVDDATAVDRLAAALGDLVLNPASVKPWKMYEFSLSDPDETLVRVGTHVTRKDRE